MSLSTLLEGVLNNAPPGYDWGAMTTPEELDERKASILRAIVSHYVGSGEPVGSKTLVDRFSLGVSSATVRNEMGALEEAGYIYQPHTSAGRIPTDHGYRYFVDSWGAQGALPANDARRVERFFGEPRWELEDALRETASLLSNLTDHAAVVFTPALDRSVVRKVELVRLSTDRAMLLMVTDTGRVENHVVVIPEEIADDDLEDAGRTLDGLVRDQTLHDAVGFIDSSHDRFPTELKDAVSNVARAMRDELTRLETDRVFLEGTSNIVDEQKFSDLETVRQVIGALEHRRLVLEMLADALAAGSTSVRIGSENAAQEMQHCSVVVAPYGHEGQALGSLGVVGPTRMDYGRTIAAVNQVAIALGQMLRELGV
jgi:heat-inducible transcriptional repressor